MKPNYVSASLSKFITKEEYNKLIVYSSEHKLWASVDKYNTSVASKCLI